MAIRTGHGGGDVIFATLRYLQLSVSGVTAWGEEDCVLVGVPLQAFLAEMFGLS
jgi:hypothetical protein